MPAKKKRKGLGPEVDEPPSENSAADGGGPEPPEELNLRDARHPEDGGVEQHPVHDDDQEDLGPEDFEEEIDAAAKGGFDTTDKYEMEHKAGRKLKEPGKV
jgi:hypothetical protein